MTSKFCVLSNPPASLIYLHVLTMLSHVNIFLGNDTSWETTLAGNAHFLQIQDSQIDREFIWLCNSLTTRTFSGGDNPSRIPGDNPLSDNPFVNKNQSLSDNPSKSNLLLNNPPEILIKHPCIWPTIEGNIDPYLNSSRLQSNLDFDCHKTSNQGYEMGRHVEIDRK